MRNESELIIDQILAIYTLVVNNLLTRKIIFLDWNKLKGESFCDNDL